MPECYTHSVIAFQAMARSAQVVSMPQGFMAGANGLQIFGYYKASNKAKNTKFKSIAARMAQEKTGDFLLYLVQNAQTPELQSYTLGFIAHYATCCIMNPYISAMCKEGQPYSMANGKQWLLSSIDSMLALRDFKTRIPPLELSVPLLVGDELAQISSFLHEAIKEVYGIDISIVELSDVFHDMRKVKKKLQCNKFSGIIMPIRHLQLYQWKSPGFFKSKQQPAPPLKQLPATWQNPYTEKSYNVTLDELLVQASQGSSTCINACIDYWLGKNDLIKLRRILGNKDYRTGSTIVLQEA